jgi:hypothetical protein
MNVLIDCNSPVFEEFNVVRLDRDIPMINGGFKEKFPFRIDIKIYNEEHMKPDQKISVTTKLDIDGLVLFYQQENVMRIKDYFFDKFLNAITGGGEDPNKSASMSQTQKWFVTNKGLVNQKTNFKQFVLEQNEKYSYVLINMIRPKIIIKDRPKFRDGLVLDITHLKMENQIKTKKGRWYNFPEKEYLESHFKI